MSEIVLTPAEAAVLEQRLPPALTEPMRELALCLYTVLVAHARHGGAAHADALLGELAELAAAQVRYLSAHMGGAGIYLAKGLQTMLAARDELIYARFDGRNYAALARQHDLTEMRVRQIVAEQRARDLARRQGRLPGIDEG